MLHIRKMLGWVTVLALCAGCAASGVVAEESTLTVWPMIARYLSGEALEDRDTAVAIAFSSLPGWTRMLDS